MTNMWMTWGFLLALAGCALDDRGLGDDGAGGRPVGGGGAAGAVLGDAGGGAGADGGGGAAGARQTGSGGAAGTGGQDGRGGASGAGGGGAGGALAAGGGGGSGAGAAGASGSGGAGGRDPAAGGAPGGAGGQLGAGGAAGAGGAPWCAGPWPASTPLCATIDQPYAGHVDVAPNRCPSTRSVPPFGELPMVWCADSRGAIVGGCVAGAAPLDANGCTPPAVYCVATSCTAG